MSAANRNYLWTQVFVDELARCGLRAVCIAPGSRSTPLTIAFAEHPNIQVYSLIDERGAAFFALGLALATGQPVALVCSSGTATANFYPAVIEANYSRVPLLVLTADRPPELRASGANQTVDQVKLYGDHVRWFYDVALPESDPPRLAVRNLRTLAARAYALADGLPRGPVHLNFPFRKPLEPTPIAADNTEDRTGRLDGEPYTNVSLGIMMPSPAQIESAARLMNESGRGVILCGPRCPSGDFPDAVRKLAAAVGYPIVADALSGLRFGYEDSHVLGSYEFYWSEFMKTAGPPDVILHFGAMPTSKALEDFLTSGQAGRHIVVSADGVWLDSSHTADHFIWAEPATFCRQLIEQVHSTCDQQWVSMLETVEQTTRTALVNAADGMFFDALALQDVLAALPDGGHLFVGNSLPVRHLDQFAGVTDKSVSTYANRGASGIDGVISTALGVAATTDVPLVLVIGDLSFYHDLNALMTVHRLGVRATIVVLNNDGGGIFRRLPVADYDPPFTTLFLTPHGLTFEPVARMFGLNYHRADSRLALRDALRVALSAGTATVIEVPTNAEDDQRQRRTVQQRVSDALTAAGLFKQPPV